MDGVFRSMSKKDLVLDWVDPSHKSKAPFRIVLNYGIVSDPDVKAEFGFKNDIPVYSITTAYPVLALKDRANVRQSKRSVTVMPVDYRPPHTGQSQRWFKRMRRPISASHTTMSQKF